MSDQEKQYDASSFKRLKGVQPIRINPHNTLDGSGMNAIYQLFREVTDNIIDESKEVTSRKIRGTIEFFPDGKVKIADNGRGIPVDIHAEEGVPAVYLAFEEMNAGSKIAGFSSYDKSIGANGIGLSAVNACSKRLDITIKREGKVHHLAYEMGERVSDLAVIGTCDPNDTGTTIEFIYDPTVLKAQDEYRTYEYPFVLSRVRNHLQDYVTFNRNVEFVVTYDTPVDGQGTWEFTSNNFSPEALITGASLGKAYKISHKSDKPDYDVDVVFGVNKELHNKIQLAAINGSNVAAGAHIDAFTESLFDFIATVFRSRGLISAELPLAMDIVTDRINYVIMLNTNVKQYKGQVKNNYSSYEVGYSLRQNFGPELFERTFDSDELNQLIDEISIVYSTRLSEFRAIREAREKKLPKHSKQTITEDLSNFHDCKNGPRLAAKNSVWFVEGNSAANPIAESRDPDTVAYVEMQGKPLNVNKMNSLDRIQKNKAFRLVQHIVSMNKFSKYVICTDGDDDGAHIQILMLLIFYYHFPEVIRNGQLYICHAPLFLMQRAGEERFFLGEEEEAAKASGWQQVRRFKGLGEMTADQVRRSLFGEATFSKISPLSFGRAEEDGRTAEEIIRDLTSNNTRGRKELLDYMADDSLRDFYASRAAIKRSFDSKINPQLLDENGVPLTQEELDALEETEDKSDYSEADGTDDFAEDDAYDYELTS